MLEDFNAPGTSFVPQAIPYTAAEQAYNNVHFSIPNPNGRFALWPQTNVLRWDVSGGQGAGNDNGITFPVIVHINSSTTEPNEQLYNTIATITTGDSNFTAQRTVPYLFGVRDSFTGWSLGD